MSASSQYMSKRERIEQNPDYGRFFERGGNVVLVRCSYPMHGDGRYTITGRHHGESKNIHQIFGFGTGAGDSW